jgi:hypothetical protein
VINEKSGSIRFMTPQAGLLRTAQRVDFCLGRHPRASTWYHASSVSKIESVPTTTIWAHKFEQLNNIETLTIKKERRNIMLHFKVSSLIVPCLTALALSPWTVRATDWPMLDYMYEIKGKGTVAGVHNKYSRTPNSFSQTAQQKSDKVPGLWSGDFLFDAENIANRWTMVNEAKRQYEQGALVNIMWHACNPTLAEPCNWSDHCSGDGPWSDISDGDWQQLVRSLHNHCPCLVGGCNPENPL